VLHIAFISRLASNLLRGALDWLERVHELVSPEEIQLVRRIAAWSTARLVAAFRF
jgi:hypothetical protein